MVIGSKPIGNVSDGQLGSLLQGSPLSGTTRVHGDLGSQLVGSIVVYDRPTLGFYLCNANQLGAIRSASELRQQSLGGSIVVNSKISSFANAVGTIGVVAYCSSQGLQVMQSAADLRSTLSANQLGSRFDAVTLGKIIQGQELGSFVYGSQFVGAVNQLGSLGLGVKPLGIMEP
jgi:hypothetical protein